MHPKATVYFLILFDRSLLPIIMSDCQLKLQLAVMTVELMLKWVFVCHYGYVGGKPDSMDVFRCFRKEHAHLTLGLLVFLVYSLTSWEKCFLVQMTPLSNDLNACCVDDGWCRRRACAGQAEDGWNWGTGGYVPEVVWYSPVVVSLSMVLNCRLVMSEKLAVFPLAGGRKHF